MDALDEYRKTIRAAFEGYNFRGQDFSSTLTEVNIAADQLLGTYLEDIPEDVLIEIFANFARLNMTACEDRKEAENLAAMRIEDYADSLFVHHERREEIKEAICGDFLKETIDLEPEQSEAPPPIYDGPV